MDRLPWSYSASCSRLPGQKMRRAKAPMGQAASAARWAASRPNGWRGRKTSPLLPICRANGSTRCTSGVGGQEPAPAKAAVKWTRLSCRSFAANAVRLQLHALAYNLGNFDADAGDAEDGGAVVADQLA